MKTALIYFSNSIDKILQSLFDVLFSKPNYTMYMYNVYVYVCECVCVCECYIPICAGVWTCIYGYVCTSVRMPDSSQY